MGKVDRERIRQIANILRDAAGKNSRHVRIGHATETAMQAVREAWEGH